MDGHSENKRNSVQIKGVNFLGEFSHCGYKENLKKLGNFRFSSVNSRKKMHIEWKKLTMFTNQKIDKRRKGKKNTGTEVYMCAP